MTAAPKLLVGAVCCLCRPALTFMREHHIAHADLSNENVLIVVSTYCIKVIDFGTLVCTSAPGHGGGSY
jgi:hypothetical protein